MDDTIKISEEEYAELEEKAKEVLGTLDSQSVNELREKCIKELHKIGSELSKRVDSYTKNLDGYLEEYEKFDKNNPLKKAVKNYWLTQLANFVAVAVFKVPRELTPSVGYPFGLSKFKKRLKKEVDEVTSIYKDGIEFCSNSLEYFNKIDDRIKKDDTNLMVFCEACENIDSEFLQVKTDPRFKKIATLIYQNNIPYSSHTFNLNLTMDAITDAVDTLAGNVCEQYDRIKENKKIL